MRRYMYDSKTIYVDKDKNGSRQGDIMLCTPNIFKRCCCENNFINLEIQGG